MRRIRFETKIVGLTGDELNCPASMRCRAVTSQTYPMVHRKTAAKVSKRSKLIDKMTCRAQAFSVYCHAGRWCLGPCCPSRPHLIGRQGSDMKVCVGLVCVGFIISQANTAASQNADVILEDVLRAEWCVQDTSTLDAVYRTIGEEARFSEEDFTAWDCEPQREYISDVIFKAESKLRWQVSFTGWMIECSCQQSGRGSIGRSNGLRTD